MESWPKMTGVKRDYINDDKLRLLLENNMRGDPCSVLYNRHVKRGERKIQYWDINHLYGWSMSQFLPTGVMKLNLQKEVMKEIH